MEDIVEVVDDGEVNGDINEDIDEDIDEDIYGGGGLGVHMEEDAREYDVMDRRGPRIQISPSWYRQRTWLGKRCQHSS
jgi:hypothetical protein